MAATPLPVFTPARYAQLAAIAVAQIFDMQVSADTTAYVTLLEGSPIVVAPCTAVASTTATATDGVNSMTVADATGIAVGQVVYSPGNFASGTRVTSVNGTVIGTSNTALQDMSGATVKFFTPVTNNTGIAVTIGAPLALGIGANTHLGYISNAGGFTNGLFNVAVGS